MKTNELEIRLTDDEMELRADAAGNLPKLVGYPIKWGETSQDLGGFKERIMRGATTAAIAANDIRALVSHDPEKLLGRTSNRTLAITEDDKGVRVEIDTPDTSYARDLTFLVKRGDIKQMSFGFKVPEGGQKFVRENGVMIRELSAINLREVSAVANPAYLGTSLTVRVDPSVVQFLTEENRKPNFDRCRAVLRSLLVKG